MRYIPIVLLAALSPPVLAEEPAPPPAERGFVAAFAGPAFMTSEGSESDSGHFSFGGRLGWTLGADGTGRGFLGLSVGSMSESESTAGVEVDATTTVIALEYLARKVGGSGLYFGALAGLSMNSVTLNGSSDASDTVFAFAPVIGYEVPLGNAASLVFDVAWVNIGEGEFVFDSGAVVPYDNTAAVTLHFGLGFGF